MEGEVGMVSFRNATGVNRSRLRNYFNDIPPQLQDQAPSSVLSISCPVFAASELHPGTHPWGRGAIQRVGSPPDLASSTIKHHYFDQPS